MTVDSGKLNRATAAFGVSAAIVVLFNTLLACVKDVNQPLLRLMNSIAGHNWTTQGIVDLVLFFGLGFVAMRTRWPENIGPRRLILLVVWSAVIAAVVLAAWYALF
jgi:hypothetical protein